jgi:hypothetical protein
MSKRKTHVQFVKEIEDIYGENIYTFLGEYVNTTTKILTKHNECDYEWDVYPRNLLTGQSKCPNCSGRIKCNTESFKKKVYDIVGDEYEVLSDYRNALIQVKFKHIVCDYIWNMTPAQFTARGQRCPRCQNRERYTDDEFKRKVEEVTNAEYKVLDSYINNYTFLKFIHTNCDTVFESAPINFMYSNSRCPNCKDSMSNGERKIFNHLTEKQLVFKKEYTFPDCSYINLLRFDFALFHDDNVTLLIEFDGEQHYRPIDWFGGEEGFVEGQKRDQIKNQYCIDNNIPLLRIPYWDENNIDCILNDYLKLIN